MRVLTMPLVAITKATIASVTAFTPHMTNKYNNGVISTSRFVFQSPLGNHCYRGMVSLHGQTCVQNVPRSSRKSSKGLHASRLSVLESGGGDRPPDPASLSSPDQLDANVSKLVDWFRDKKSILCITGAGLSTESGIPDYRGHEGAYHNGHKPMVHDQFMNSESQRRRYWGRSMMGWKQFQGTKPNDGHYALTRLEHAGKIGVTFKDHISYYETTEQHQTTTTNEFRNLSIITQNVDGLHRKANSKYVIELHGRGDIIKCMNCGSIRNRNDYHLELESENDEWLLLNLHQEKKKKEENSSSKLRPDGDAELQLESFDDFIVPSCPVCEAATTAKTKQKFSNNNNNDNNNNNNGRNFYKPDVVFFGDSVPRPRVEACYGAVQEADGLFCIGSSLAVHSAFRFVQAAAKRDIPIAVLNVGITRAETSGLDVLKIESAAGPTLTRLADALLLLDGDDDDDNPSLAMSTSSSLLSSSSPYGEIKGAKVVS